MGSLTADSYGCALKIRNVITARAKTESVKNGSRRSRG